MTPGDYDKTMPLTRSDLEGGGAEGDFPDDLPPALAGRYRFRRVLGEGAFGVVYLAEDTRIGRLVAIKRLRHAAESDSRAVKRFIQEAKISGQLEHPNIITVYNFESDDNALSIVMEYLGGGSLADLMDRTGPMNFKLAARTMLSVLTGLEAAHHLLVAHRDIKPRNILFAIAGSPKISDFGVARLPVDLGLSGLDDAAQGRSVIGTPLYMAPEQARGEPGDKRVDIYAAGAVFYQALTGKPPLALRRGMTLEEMGDIIQNAEPEPLSKLRPDLPENVGGVLSQALAKNAADRYPSAAAFSKDLLNVLAANAPAGLSEDILVSPSGNVVSTGAAILEDIVDLLLLDGTMSPEERRELEKRAEKLGVSPSQARAIEREVRARRNLPALEDLDALTALIRTYYRANDDAALTPGQEAIVARKQRELGVQDRELEGLKREAARGGVRR